MLQPSATTWLHIPAPPGLSRDMAEEIEKQSVYVSTHIRRIVLMEDGRRFGVDHDGALPADLVAGKASRFLDAMLSGLRPFELTVLSSNRRREPVLPQHDVYQQLTRREWVVELGPGQVALSGPALALANAIDRACAGVGRDAFGGVERHYPTLIPTEHLAQCGYLGSFPQHLGLVGHLREDFDAIEAFRRANGAGGALQAPPQEALDLGKACLCPALCYHCYPTLRGRRLPPAGHVETSIGRVCRYESGNTRGLDRLWEFTQRSIIWVGTEAFCLDLRQRALDTAMQLAAEWDVDCTVESANDPFFASVSTAKSLWQRSQELKYELRAGIAPSEQGGSRTLAAASFNLHGPFFGKAFDILDADGLPACSGCVSWGLERWVLVLFTQHGFDPACWPVSLRHQVFG